MPARIVLVTASNSALLGRIAVDVFDEPVDAAHLAVYVADPRHAMFVAIADDEVVGQIRGNVHLQPDRTPDLYIDNLGVTPARKREGIATALIGALTAWGQTHGCAYAWVATEPDNEDGIGFYEAQRFERRTLEWFASNLLDDAAS